MINLHLTPNGCGIFGCGKDNDFPVRKDERYPEDDFYYQDNNRFNIDPYQTRRQQVKFQSDFKPSRPVSRPSYDERPYREDFDSYHRPSNQDHYRQRSFFHQCFGSFSLFFISKGFVILRYVKDLLGNTFIATTTNA